MLSDPATSVSTLAPSQLPNSATLPTRSRPMWTALRTALLMPGASLRRCPATGCRTLTTMFWSRAMAKAISAPLLTPWWPHTGRRTRAGVPPPAQPLVPGMGARASRRLRRPAGAARRLGAQDQEVVAPLGLGEHGLPGLAVRSPHQGADVVGLLPVAGRLRG